MGLVEIILGKQTAPQRWQRRSISCRKSARQPIVVNDSRGFYTSRCFGTYTREGMAMLSEGIHPAMIENVGRMAGMPMGPLESWIRWASIRRSRSRARRARNWALRARTPRKSCCMAGRENRTGRAARRAGASTITTRKETLAPVARPRASRSGEWRTDADVEEMKARFLTIQALEAARCFEEHVITDPRDADVGAILGWGFAPFTGGPVSLIDTLGAAAFVARCETFVAKFGERFRPNRLLRDHGGTQRNLLRPLRSGEAGRVNERKRFTARKSQRRK